MLSSGENPKRNRRRLRPTETPLLQGCSSSDSCDYTHTSNNFSETEDWCRFGDIQTSGDTTSPFARPSSEQPPPEISEPRQRRGRSPIRPLFAPTVWESPERERHRHRKARSLEPKRWTLRATSPSNSSASTLNCYNVPNSAAETLVGTPVPSDYIDHIVTAYGDSVDLYRDVLGISNYPPRSGKVTPAQLRVAYFRMGRKVLQEKNQTSPGSVADFEGEVTPKQRFQAVTKAYEILTNPAWRAYYEAYGLTRSPQIVGECYASMPPAEDDDGAISVQSGGSSSILRRSNSWGPARSRSTSRTRVCWSEEVEELVYQPDPVNTSNEWSANHENDVQSMDEVVVGDTSAVIVSARTEKPRKVNKKSRIVIDSPGLAEDLEQFDQAFKRDFLDDLEMSLDGLEARIGGIVNFPWTRTKSDANTLNPVGNSRQAIAEEKKDDSDSEKREESVEPQSTSADDSTIVKKLFSDLTKPMNFQVDKAANANSQTSSTQCDGPSSNESDRVASTKSAPLKEGNVDKPRVKPKKWKRSLKGVDKVPADASFEALARKSGPELVLNPTRTSGPPALDDSTNSWPLQSALHAVLDLLGTNNTASHSESDRIRIASHHTALLDHFELQSNSSILASIGDASGDCEATPLAGAFQFGNQSSLPFVDALNISTDATTKGFVRLDRFNDQSSMPSRSTMDTSDITYLSKTTAELMSQNLPDCFSTLTKHAQETLREVASLDETEIPTRPSTATEKKSQMSSGAVSFMASVNEYFQSLAEGINSFGFTMSSNIEDANRAVVETMSFPQDEVGGMLQVLESELNTPGDISRDSFLSKSLTF